MFKRLFLLFATFSILGFSCKKNDLPPYKKNYQIKKISRQDGPTSTGTFEYSYNAQRQLTQLSMSALPEQTLEFQYDSQGRPVVIKAGTLFKDVLIYQNGNVVRIERLDLLDQLFDEAFFSYDSRNRLVERIGFTSDYNKMTYEYEGNSTNPKRKLIWGFPIPTPGAKGTKGTEGPLGPQDQGLEVQFVYEYTYDKRINPQSTLTGLTLCPLNFGQENLIDRYEPIPENNVVYQRFLQKVGNQMLMYGEYFINYEYNPFYPVKETHRKVLVSPNPDLPPTESFSSATYVYENKN